MEAHTKSSTSSASWADPSWADVICPFSSRTEPEPRLHYARRSLIHGTLLCILCKFEGGAEEVEERLREETRSFFLLHPDLEEPDTKAQTEELQQFALEIFDSNLAAKRAAQCVKAYSRACQYPPLPYSVVADVVEKAASRRLRRLSGRRRAA